MEYIAFTKTKLPYGWLGNMAPYQIEYDGKTWKTTEALFQALRFSDDDLREKIRLEASPIGAKTIAVENIDKAKVRPTSMDDIKNMWLCLKLKVEQHPELKSMLLATRDLPIYEDVTSRGNKGNNLFWGAMLIDGKWVGQNVVGRLWMELRERLKKEENE